MTAIQSLVAAAAPGKVEFVLPGLTIFFAEQFQGVTLIGGQCPIFCGGYLLGLVVTRCDPAVGVIAKILEAADWKVCFQDFFAVGEFLLALQQLGAVDNADEDLLVVLACRLCHKEFATVENFTHCKPLGWCFVDKGNCLVVVCSVKSNDGLHCFPFLRDLP